MTSTAKPNILVNFKIDPKIVSEVLKPEANVWISKNPKDFQKKLKEADGLVTLLTTPINEALLKKAPQLKVVGNVAVGVDNIDLKACAKRDIQVCNTPHVLTRATAELTLALLLAAAKRIPEGEAMVRKNRYKGWALDMLLGQQLEGRQALIVGAGRIGKQVHRLFRGIGLKTEFVTSRDSNSIVAKRLKRAQIVSIHLPLTKKTRHWLNATRIRQLRSDCIVLNTSRGPVVDEKALITALRKRSIFSAGLDVYEKEPQIPQTLRKLPNCVLLPHLGSATEETRYAMARLAAEGVVGVLGGQRPRNLVKTSI